MATIEERIDNDGSTSYRVKVRLKGCPQQTATFARKTDAKKWAQDIESAIRDGRHFKYSEAKKHTLAELIDRYTRDILPTKTNNKKTQKVQGQQLAWWKEQIGAYALADVTPALLAEYRDKLASEYIRPGVKRSPSTITRYMAALSHAFSIAVKEWGWLEDSPMRKVSKPKEPRGRVRYLSDAERDRLLTTCKESNHPYLYAVVVLALATGMRQGEILNIRWDDVNFEHNYLILHQTKNGERRRIPLSMHAKHALLNMHENQTIASKFVFPDYKTNRPDKPFHIRNAWNNAVARAELDDFRFHDLRHSAASYLAMSGASLAEIAEVLGHKTLAMVKRYSHLSEAHTASVVERMNTKIFGETS